MITMSKKKKYSVEELKKIGQGERLAALRVELGFKTRKSFAISINYSASTLDAIEEFKRPISKNLITAIDNKYKNQYDKEWLLSGAPKKLLTDERFLARMIEDKIEVIEGDPECYGCKIKEKELKELRIKYNKLLEDYNDCLREVLELRKASSG